MNVNKNNIFVDVNMNMKSSPAQNSFCYFCICTISSFVTRCLGTNVEVTIVNLDDVT